MDEWERFLAEVYRLRGEPEFQGWLSRMDEQVGLFLENDVPGVVVVRSPFSEESVLAVVDILIERFGEWRSLNHLENDVLIDRVKRYIGSSIAENFDGEWVCSPAMDEHMDPAVMGPAVHVPYHGTLIFPLDQLRRPFGEKSSKSITRTFNNLRELRNIWEDLGRPNDSRVVADEHLRRIGISFD